MLSDKSDKDNKPSQTPGGFFSGPKLPRSTSNDQLAIEEQMNTAVLDDEMTEVPSPIQFDKEQLNRDIQARMAQLMLGTPNQSQMNISQDKDFISENSIYSKTLRDFKEAILRIITEDRLKVAPKGLADEAAKLRGFAQDPHIDLFSLHQATYFYVLKGEQVAAGLWSYVTTVSVPFLAELQVLIAADMEYNPQNLLKKWHADAKDKISKEAVEYVRIEEQTRYKEYKEKALEASYFVLNRKLDESRITMEKTLNQSLEASRSYKDKAAQLMLVDPRKAPSLSTALQHNTGLIKKNEEQTQQAIEKRFKQYCSDKTFIVLEKLSEYIKVLEQALRAEKDMERMGMPASNKLIQIRYDSVKKLFLELVLNAKSNKTNDILNDFRLDCAEKVTLTQIGGFIEGIFRDKAYAEAKDTLPKFDERDKLTQVKNFYAMGIIFPNDRDQAKELQKQLTQPQRLTGGRKPN